MVDFSKLDKIEITLEDLKVIHEWVGSNADKLRVANPILNEGLIEYINEDATIYFKVVSESKIQFKYYAKLSENFKKKDLLISFDLENPFNLLGSLMTGKTYRNNQGWIRKTNIVVNELLNKKDFIRYQMLIDSTTDMCRGVFLDVMTYAQFYREHMTQQTRKYVKNTGNKKPFNSKSHKVKLTKVYKLNVENAHLDKRVFTRHIEYWTVRGHWRTTKTGKQVWIKPFYKGNKDKMFGKTYKI